MTDRNNAEPATRLLAVAGTLASNSVRQGEMGLAAAQTIGYRTAMLAAAFGNPAKLANPEFIRMGAEKVEAAAEAAQEMAEGFAELQHAFMAMFTGQARMAVTLLGGLGTARSPGEVVGLFEESINAGLNAGIHFAESAASFTAAGLGPIHRKTRSNARRLARKSLWS